MFRLIGRFSFRLLDDRQRSVSLGYETRKLLACIIPYPRQGVDSLHFTSHIFGNAAKLGYHQRIVFSRTHTAAGIKFPRPNFHVRAFLGFTSPTSVPIFLSASTTKIICEKSGFPAPHPKSWFYLVEGIPQLSSSLASLMHFYFFYCALRELSPRPDLPPRRISKMRRRPVKQNKT